MALGPGGTAFQTIVDGATNETTVLTIGPTGVTPTTLTGIAYSWPVVGPDGTAYQTISNDAANETTVLVIRPDGATPITLTGIARETVVVYPDGTVYQMVNDNGTTALWLVGASPVPDQTLAGAATPVTQVNDSSGAIGGALHIANPYHDILSYTVAGGPAEGTVTIDPNGTFTYTPTVQTRRDAAADTAIPADLQDNFTVTVSDAHGGSTTVPVWVAIDPATTPPTRSLRFHDPDGRTGAVNTSVTVIDPDNDPVTYLVLHDPSYGRLASASPSQAPN